MPVFTTPFGLLLALQLATAPPAPAPPEPSPEGSGAGASSELAAEAPVPAWVPEGGSAAHKSGEDPTEVNRKVRNAARTTIAGGAIALFGVAAGIGGLVMYTIPKKQLGKLRDDNNGNLPPSVNGTITGSVPLGKGVSGSPIDLRR